MSNPKEFDPIKNTKNLADEREQAIKASGRDLLNQHNLTGRVYFESLGRSGVFWHPNADGEWVSDSSTEFDDYLLAAGVDPNRPEKGVLSELKRVKQHIRDYYRVDFVGALAGYPAGFRFVNGYRVLITQPPRWIEPQAEPGCPTILDFIDGMFAPGDGDNIDQRPFFFGWLKHALLGLEENRRPDGTNDALRGMAFILVGDKASGKTFLTKKIIRPLLGNRECKPYRYFYGEEKFNGSFVSSELWVCDDEQSARDGKSRSVFSANVKGAVADPTYRIRGMHKDEVALDIFRRLIILCNREPERIQALPQLDSDMDDKVMILSARNTPFPVDNQTMEERREVDRLFAEELPSFAYWLLSVWEDETGATKATPGSPLRFGVQPFHHPDVKQCLFDVSAEFHIWEQIKRTLFPSRELCSVWNEHLSASELLERLKDSDSPLTNRERDKLPSGEAVFGKIINKIADNQPEQVTHKRKIRGKEGYVFVRSDRVLSDAVELLKARR